jgi:hypothetical protein
MNFAGAYLNRFGKNARRVGSPAFFKEALLRRSTLARRCASSAFTLIEIVIASGILFMCLFAILGLLANVLRNARALQNRASAGEVLGSIAAKVYVHYANTNQVNEGPVSVDFDDLEDIYPDYTWDTPELLQIGTNSLFVVDINVRRRSGGEAAHMSFLVYGRGTRPVRPSANLR